MKVPSEQVSEVLRLADLGENPNIQPNILLNHNIDPTKISEVTSWPVNDDHSYRLKKMLKRGYIIFRIQTEFSITGHVTMAYLAKLKKAE